LTSIGLRPAAPCFRPSVRLLGLVISPALAVPVGLVGLGVLGGQGVLGVLVGLVTKTRRPGRFPNLVRLR